MKNKNFIFKFDQVQHYQLYEPLLTFFPDLEYIVRAGWTPDAKQSVTVISLLCIGCVTAFLSRERSYP
jgi:hypothetical protein